MNWPDWSGETVAIIGSGPSRTIEQLERIRGRCRAIVLCHEFRYAPWADWLHASDWSWWLANAGDARSFEGIRSTYSASMSNDMRIHRLHPWIERGRDSGVQALQISIYCNVARVLLIGIDMKPGPGNREHAHDRYIGHPVRQPADYPAMMEPYRVVADHIGFGKPGVLNCSPGSALDCFKRADLADILP